MQKKFPIRGQVDRLTAKSPEDVQDNVDQNAKSNRPFAKGNKASAGRKPKLAKLGINMRPGQDPIYQAALRAAEQYRRVRIREVLNTHGWISVGVKSLIATSALQIAISRWMMEKAVEEGNMDMVKKASQIANDARQNDIAAFELASREGGAKAKNRQREQPWMVRVSDEVVQEAEEQEVVEEVEPPTFPELAIPVPAEEPEAVTVPDVFVQSTVDTPEPDEQLGGAEELKAPITRRALKKLIL